MKSTLGGYSHLQGTAKFEASTCIGNWYEEREMRRSILKDIVARRTTGTKLAAFQQRMGAALSEVELTKVADDPYVHFGDVLQVVHCETGHVLAGDVSDQDPRPAEEACAATAAPEIRAPCARNTFILLKYKPDKHAPLEPYYDDDVLHFGQKVRIALNPMSVGEPADAQGGPRPMCLFSKAPSATYYAKYSRKQLVGLTSRHTYDTVWQVVTPDPSQRVVSEGVEVLAGAPILLIHAATQKPLIVELGQIYPNSFGNEWELSARQETSAGLKLSLEQTAKGILKGSLPKGESPLNFFTFITGDKVERLPEAPASATVDASLASSALSMLVSDLKASAGSQALMEKKLVTLSNEKSELPAAELLLIVRQCGVRISESDVEALAKQFSTHKAGVLDAGELLKAMRAVAAAP